MDENELRRLVDAIVSTTQPLQVILFGSRARDAADPDSDVDVCVVVPDGVHRRRAAQAIYAALAGLRVPADIVVATLSDLRDHADTPGLVYREILRDGKLVYAAQ